MWISAIVTCLAWLLGTAGLIVLAGTAKRWLRDAGMIFLIGIAVAGFCGMALTDQSGSSQMYFHRTAVPIIAVLAAVGAHLLVFNLRKARWLVLGSVLGGMAATVVARRITRALPTDAVLFRREDGTLTGLVLPWVLTIGLLALVASRYGAVEIAERAAADRAGVVRAGRHGCRSVTSGARTAAWTSRSPLEPLTDEHAAGTVGHADWPLRDGCATTRPRTN